MLTDVFVLIGIFVLDIIVLIARPQLLLSVMVRCLLAPLVSLYVLSRFYPHSCFVLVATVGVVKCKLTRINGYNR